MNAENEKLKDFNATLGDVENRLLHRALGRSRKDAERGYDFVNKAVEAGFADIDCGEGDEPEAPGADAAADGQEQGVSEDPPPEAEGQPGEEPEGETE